MGVEIVESEDGVEIILPNVTLRLTGEEAEELRDRLARPGGDKDDFTDLRPGDIVEFDHCGTHYGPQSCCNDGAGGWIAYDDETRRGEWFLNADREPLAGISNIVIHRELRVREPEEPGLYATQSGMLLLRRSEDCTYPWLRTEGVWADGDGSEVWEAVVGQLGESEFPLRKVKATLE